jgi:hypothetical protein
VPHLQQPLQLRSLPTVNAAQIVDLSVTIRGCFHNWHEHRPGQIQRFEQGLAELGQAMKDVESTQSNVHEMPLAGYTYLGQFIDHDLTLDITPLEFAQPTAECIHNFRAQFLDLDHVYAGDPNISSFLYETDGPPGNERFLLSMPDLFAVALVGCAEMSSHNHNTCQ